MQFLSRFLRPLPKRLLSILGAILAPFCIFLGFRCCQGPSWGPLRPSGDGLWSLLGRCRPNLARNSENHKILQKPKENRRFCNVGLRGSDAKKRRFRTSFWDPKRVENRSKRSSETGWKINRVSDAIFVDFGTILAPKTPPKIVQKQSEKRPKRTFWALGPET